MTNPWACACACHRSLSSRIRELKQRGRQRERERHKTMGLVNAQKQSLCTCVLHFATFLCCPLQNTGMTKF